MKAAEIIAKLDLQPHPEGGWYRETWRAETAQGQRPSGTAIYYLLERGQRSHWHRVDADEIWHWYAGDALRLSIAETNDSAPTEHILGPDLFNDQSPQIRVPRHQWQSAEPLGDWTLVGCTVSPGFLFEGFEMAAPDWQPSPKR